MPDTMKIEILEDGQLKIQTEGISEANHMSADEFLEGLEEVMGTKRISTKLEHPFWKNRIVQRGGKVLKVGN